jgi:excisionase family DNA binding protein
MIELQTPTRPEPKRRPTRRQEPERLAVPVNDACKIIGLGRTAIYDLIAQGKLKSVAIGRRRLVLYSSIKALLQPQTA